MPSNPRLTVLLIGLLMGLQAVTTDLYLPALPLLTESLQGTIAHAQLTLTLLLLAFGLSQLIWGPLSDHFGRRPILLIGLGLYCLSAWLCVRSTSMHELIIWRCLQGAGMGAAVVCARAIVRDSFQADESPRVMAQALGILGLMAVVSPLLGGWLVNTYSWSASLAGVLLIGLIVFVLVLLFYKESLGLDKRSSLSFATLIVKSKAIFQHKSFLSYMLLLALSYAALFTFLASSSFIFIQVFGFTKSAYGLILSLNALFYFLGTLECRRMLRDWGLQKTVSIGGWLSLLGGTSIGVLALLGWHTWWAYMIPHLIFIISHSINQPCAQAGVVAPFPKSAGTASALSGAFMMLVAFGVGQWLGWRMDGTVYPLTNGMWFWCSMVSLCIFTVVRKYGSIDNHDKR